MTPFVTIFYSYKGGVGRTLLAANVAILLARRGKTLLWDLDIEAPGLHRIPELTPTQGRILRVVVGLAEVRGCARCC